MLPLLPRSLDPGSQSSMIVYAWTNFDARRYSVFPNRCIHLIFKIIKARFSEHSMNHFVHACNVLTMEVPCQVPVYFLVVGKKSSVHGWSVKDLVLINKKLRSTSLECFRYTCIIFRHNFVCKCPFSIHYSYTGELHTADRVNDKNVCLPLLNCLCIAMGGF